MLVNIPYVEHIWVLMKKNIIQVLILLITIINIKVDGYFVINMYFVINIPQTDWIKIVSKRIAEEVPRLSRWGFSSLHLENSQIRETHIFGSYLDIFGYIWDIPK